MLVNLIGEKLIEELLRNPKRFNKQGKAYQLLQEYFNGYPLETLQDLLSNNDMLVQRAAVFVVSELGSRGKKLIHYVVPLIYIDNQYIQYHALESVMVCSVVENVNEFIHVVRAIESNNEVIRNLAMHLISNADDYQLKAGIEVCESSVNDKIYIKGLLTLLKCDSLNPGEVLRMMNDTDAVIRKFGAIAARRINQRYPELIISAKDSTDNDIRQFSEDVIDMLMG